MSNFYIFGSRNFSAITQQVRGIYEGGVRTPDAEDRGVRQLTDATLRRALAVDLQVAGGAAPSTLVDCYLRRIVTEQWMSQQS